MKNEAPLQTKDFIRKLFAQCRDHGYEQENSTRRSLDLCSVLLFL